MGRPRRAAAGGIVYHVLNRGNGRSQIFHNEGDYDAFVRILREGLDVVAGMRLLGFCLTTTTSPAGTCTRAASAALRCRTTRTCSPPCATWRPTRFEPNSPSGPTTGRGAALRSARGCRAEGLLCDWPVDRPIEWRQIVEASWAEQDLADIHRCVDRGRPFGDEPWTQRVARLLGLDLTPRARGRPRTRET